MTKSRALRIHYPWLKIPPKGSFFVPTLRLEEIREAGLKAALHNKIKADAAFGVVNGRLGVLFTRVR